jgi:hypothetical protein
MHKLGDVFELCWFIANCHAIMMIHYIYINGSSQALT